MNKKIKILAVYFVSLVLFTTLRAQSSDDTLRGRNLYKPVSIEQKDSIIRNGQQQPDEINQDSIDLRMLFIRDSIEARIQFIRDSIEAREAFIRDSIFKRQQILDSLNFLKAELPRLLDASIKTLTEYFIISPGNIVIIGDSMLGDYSSTLLPYEFAQPYAPWRSTIRLSDNSTKIIADKRQKSINSIVSASFSFTYNEVPKNKILIINEPATILNKRQGKLYSAPLDSVFFDQKGRIVKIKRYIHFYQVTGTYQKGASLFIHLSQVKQYEYGSDNRPVKYQVTNFCDQWASQDPKKVCNIITYALDIKGNAYTMQRQNDPANQYSDGTFIYEIDERYNLKSASFNNNSGSENWKTFIETNEAGYVSRYIYQNQGIVRKTLLINYFDNDPYAKNKVETITCIFEDDGNSYFQKNNTTGKSRDRDRYTGEWGPWK